jgi:hypothetical protein
LGGRQRLAVLFQALNAEELGDDWIRSVSLAADWAGNADRPLPVRLEVVMTSGFARSHERGTGS